VKRADLDPLLAAAILARTHAYAPYSRYRVGAALLTGKGRVYSGCNVESSSFGATLCAERAAVAAMVVAGDRDPVACVVVTAGPQPASPCGICRQVLSEFAVDMEVHLVAVGSRGNVLARGESRLSALFPQAFRFGQDRPARATVAGRKRGG
jgi:homotetrameric cytidine deaminase